MGTSLDWLRDENLTQIDFVSKRELNQQTAQVLARVTADSPVIITERGEPRWKLSELDAEDLHLTGLARLQALGIATRPKESHFTGSWPEYVTGPKRTSAEVDELLAELKGDH